MNLLNTKYVMGNKQMCINTLDYVLNIKLYCSYGPSVFILCILILIGTVPEIHNIML